MYAIKWQRHRGRTVSWATDFGTSNSTALSRKLRGLSSWIIASIRVLSSVADERGHRIRGLSCRFIRLFVTVFHQTETFFRLITYLPNIATSSKWISFKFLPLVCKRSYYTSCLDGSPLFPLWWNVIYSYVEYQDCSGCYHKVLHIGIALCLILSLQTKYRH